MVQITHLIIASALLVAASGSYVRVCYYTNWSQYRPSGGKFFPENIDPFLCTHIVYAFAQIGSDSTLKTFEWNDEQMYARVNNLKKLNSNLKVLLAVGGWNHENGATSRFSDMVNNNNRRQQFIDSSIEMLRRYGFDGLDLDWEYPAGRGNSPPGDRERFTQLCMELLEAFKADGRKRNVPRLLLTAAVSAGYATITAGYEISKLGSYLDLINLMTYDLHGNWETITGHHTAMASDGANVGDRALLTVPFALNVWIDGGFPRNKIALGLATYGRSFSLLKPQQNGLGSPKSGSPPKGTYTREAGFLAYYEICNAGYTFVKNNDVKAPYGYKGYEWVGFDDQDSLRYKVTSLIIGEGLAGAMFWSLDLDDFSGSFCNQGKYPLISAVVDELNGLGPTSPSTTRSSTTRMTITVPTTSETTVPTTSETTVPTTSETTEPITTTRAPLASCRATGPWKGNTAVDKWCVTNCQLNNCPLSICTCDAL